MHLTLLKETDSSGISHGKHSQWPHKQYLNILISSYFMTPAMSRQLIFNEFNSHTLTPSANLPALSTIKPRRKERIKRSALFSNTLAGRAGLLREIGASYDHGAVTSAWVKGLGHQYSLLFSLSSYFYNSYIYGFTSMVYDEDTRSIIAGMEQCESNRDHSSMSNPPLFPSS